MKISKILMGAAALTAVVGFAGCKFGAGEGETDGTKWNLTMTVDASDSAKTALDKNYRRYWSSFSNNEKCAEITTTVTIDMNEWEIPESYSSASVVGLAFDVNNTEENDDSNKSFNLIGVNPIKQMFYVERYTGIPKDEAASLDTDEGSLGKAVADLELSSMNKSSAGWCSLTDKMYTAVQEDGKQPVITCVVKITQENKKYSVYLGDVKVAEYDASDSKYTNTINEKEYAIGGIACYGNVGKGLKMTANYKTEKDAVTGKLAAEVAE